MQTALIRAEFIVILIIIISDDDDEGVEIMCPECKYIYAESTPALRSYRCCLCI